MDDNKIVGKRIKSRRQELKISRDELALNLEITTQIVANIEYGRTKIPNGVIDKLAYHLKCSKNYILFGGDIGEVDEFFELNEVERLVLLRLSNSKYKDTFRILFTLERHMNDTDRSRLINLMNGLLKDIL